jgi:threonine aldolase
MPQSAPLAPRRSDFRSDTVTQPCARMRAAMADAEVGDDVLDGDPTVRALERRGAELLGQAGALFVPSGTMANQIAVGAWTRPGDELICDAAAHILDYEGGALGYLHGVQVRAVAGQRGSLTPAQIEAAQRPRSIHCAPTALLCLEQTHMSSGGSVVPLADLDAAAQTGRRLGLKVHLDGARLMNAAVATEVAAARYTRHVDSVSLCLSKGLGAPVGSLIAGSEEFLERARVVRKRLGGWMRQAGHIAAAGLVALEHNVKRLAQDHALARSLATGLDGLGGLRCPPAEVHTNLVFVELPAGPVDAALLSQRLAGEGVLAMPLGARKLRFVTHLDLGPADVERAVAACRRALSPG